ncbi:MAG: threonine ammonia-lyase [Planctomycetota bacterium]|jgi:threonine dehydratase
MEPLDPVTLEEIAAGRRRIADLALRTPLLRLDTDEAPGEIYLKLENLQPVGSFKVRGAGNALMQLGKEAIAQGVYTASAGNMAQGLAYVARRLGVPCQAVVPEQAPRAKLGAIERFGATAVTVPFDEWWRVIETHHHDGVPGRFIHPVSDPTVIAGNGTIGVEILEDLPEADAIVVPYGGGGLSCGIAAAVRALRPATSVFAAEVDTAAPFAASLAAGEPRRIDYVASFVDGIGAKSVLPEMWPMARDLLDGSLVVGLKETAAAIRLLAGRARVIAEGAGAVGVAAALAGKAGAGRIVCVVSGGNIDPAALAAILSGRVPEPLSV